MSKEKLFSHVSDEVMLNIISNRASLLTFAESSKQLEKRASNPNLSKKQVESIYWDYVSKKRYIMDVVEFEYAGKKLSVSDVKRCPRCLKLGFFSEAEKPCYGVVAWVLDGVIVSFDTVVDRATFGSERFGCGHDFHEILYKSNSLEQRMAQRTIQQLRNHISEQNTELQQQAKAIEELNKINSSLESYKNGNKKLQEQLVKVSNHLEDVIDENKTIEGERNFAEKKLKEAEETNKQHTRSVFELSKELQIKARVLNEIKNITGITDNRALIGRLAGLKREGVL